MQNVADVAVAWVRAIVAVRNAVDVVMWVAIAVNWLVMEDVANSKQLVVSSANRLCLIVVDVVDENPLIDDGDVDVCDLLVKVGGDGDVADAGVDGGYADYDGVAQQRWQ